MNRIQELLLATLSEVYYDLTLTEPYKAKAILEAERILRQKFEEEYSN